MLISAAYEIKVWDTSTISSVAPPSPSTVFRPHTKAINDIQCSSNGKTICSCSADGTIKVSMSTGELLGTMPKDGTSKVRDDGDGDCYYRRQSIVLH